jgi:hypothetical protein
MLAADYNPPLLLDSQIFCHGAARFPAYPGAGL